MVSFPPGVALRLIIAALWACPLQAELPTGEESLTHEVVVTATRRAEAVRDEVGSSLTVIPAEEIARRQYRTVAEALRGVPGMDLVQSGGAGGNAVAFIRGANSEHTLVLIDGVEANNPITPNRAFNFSDLSIENVERIEIVRGPQSTLYGSDALGGVINIITRRGAGAARGSVSLEGGSYSTFTERAGVSGGDDRLSYSLGVFRQDSASISAANARDGNTEHDGFENTAFSARLEGELADPLSLELVSRYNTSRSDIDNGGGIGGDDPNRIFLQDQLFLRSGARARLFGGVWQQRWGFSFSDQTFEDNNDPDELHPTDRLRSEYDSQRFKFDLVNELALAPEHTLVLGAEYEREEGDSRYSSSSSWGSFSELFAEEDAHNTGWFSELRTGLGNRFDLTAGVRLDDHSFGDVETTWRVSPVIAIPETGSRVRGAIGTGFKAPSLYQRFSAYGSTELEAEESFGWDAGIEQEMFSEDLLLTATWFSNDFDNLITFDPVTYLYDNIADATSAGVEVGAAWQVHRELALRGTFTWTDTEDAATGEELLRRAREKATIEARWQASSRLSLTAAGLLVGNREDLDYSTGAPTRVTLGRYLVWSLAGEYRLSDYITIFSRLENLFDKEYEEIAGFGTPGFGAYGGVSVAL